MKTAATALEKQFASDHRELTRGFVRLLELLESGDGAEATRLANHLDQVAGPHIEFEETVLYPAAERAEGSDFAARLYVARARVFLLRRILHSDSTRLRPPLIGIGTSKRETSSFPVVPSHGSRRDASGL